MNIDEAGKIVWERMGKCWHSDKCTEFREVHSGIPIPICLKCQHIWSKNPDPASWQFFGECFEWAKKQEWWDEFLKKIGSNIYTTKIIVNKNIPSLWREEYVHVYGIPVVRSEFIGPQFIIDLAEFLTAKEAPSMQLYKCGQGRHS